MQPTMLMADFLLGVIAGSCLAQTSRPAVTAASGFLSRDGCELRLNGRPFRAVGVNKYELLDLYVADLLGEDGVAARRHAIRALDELKTLGVDVIRVQGCQFWPAHMLKTYLGDEARRRVFWSRYDEMLADCSRRGIRVVPALTFYLGLWPDLGHESFWDFICNPHSKSRVLFEQWVRDLVGRYRDAPTILFWELPNEMNLAIDMKPYRPKGIMEWSNEALMPPPVVRDGRNNITADELAAFLREITLLIKSLDSHHLVGTGCAMPRANAWHAWQGSLRRAAAMDWTRDNDEQRADHLRLITPDVIDLICAHYYLQRGSQETLDQLALIAAVARELNKPLYMGECGVLGEPFGGEIYGHAAAREGLKVLLDAMRLLDVPITLLWTYDERANTLHEPVIWPDRQPGVVGILRAAQAEAKGRQGSGSVMTMPETAAKLRALDERFRTAVSSPR